MTNAQNAAILHLRPSDPGRTAIVEYAEHFHEALKRIPNHDCLDFFSGGLDENIDATEKVSAIRDYVREKASTHTADKGAGIIVHMEQGNALHREFWAGYFLQRLLPRARFYATIHDPPKLCSNPFRYVPTEFEGRTPLRLLNVALTKLAETRVQWRKNRIEARFVRDCEGVVALSEGGRASLEKHPLFIETENHFLPHVFNLKSLSHDPFKGQKSDEEKNKPKISTQPLRIVMFCYLGPNKGTEETIEAFDLLCERLKKDSRHIPLPTLGIFGGVSQGFQADHYLETIRERIGKSAQTSRIEFSPGFVGRDERDRRLAAADIIVLPYRTVPTAFSSAGAIRALALGKAVVAANTNTLPEVVLHGESGLLFDEKSPADYADVLYQLCVDSDLRRRLGFGARRLIESRHTPDKIARRLARIYGIGWN
ncbi:MAG: glycosyltransferase family 4 protein [Candidatus Sumerlaeia bacterium]